MKCELAKFESTLKCYGVTGFYTDNQCLLEMDWETGKKKDTPATVKEVKYLAKPYSHRDKAGRKHHNCLIVTVQEEPDPTAIFVTNHGKAYEILDDSIIKLELSDTEFGYSFRVMPK